MANKVHSFWAGIVAGAAWQEPVEPDNDPLPEEDDPFAVPPSEDRLAAALEETKKISAELLKRSPVYSCQNCGKQYATRGRLNNHRRAKHKEQP
jgi:hypothetical protein